MRFIMSPSRPARFASAAGRMGRLIALTALVTVSLSDLPAHAYFLPSFVSSSPAGNGLTNYLYNLDFDALPPLTEPNSLSTGNYIVFYDVGPVTAQVSTGLTFIQALVGPQTVFQPTHNDDPNLLNAIFTYNGALGATVTTPTRFSVTITSSSTSTVAGFYTSKTTSPGGSGTDTIGPVNLPSAAVSINAAPEPGSWLLFSVGLAPVLRVLHRRNVA